MVAAAAVHQKKTERSQICVEGLCWDTKTGVVKFCAEGLCWDNDSEGGRTTNSATGVLPLQLFDGCKASDERLDQESPGVAA